MINLFQYANQINIGAGMLMGATLQYLLGNSKGKRVALIVFLSALLMAVYILHPILNIIKEISFVIPFINVAVQFDTVSGSFAYTVAMVFSSLLSAEIISLIVVILPLGMKQRFKKAIGVNDAN